MVERALERVVRVPHLSGLEAVQQEERLADMEKGGHAVNGTA